MPTFVNIAGGAKGDGLKQRIEAGQYPGIVKTTLDGFDQPAYFGHLGEVGARTFFTIREAPVRGPLQELEDVFDAGVAARRPTVLPGGVLPYHWAQVVNIKRDPFETSLGSMTKTRVRYGRGPWWSGATAYLSTIGTCCPWARRYG